MFCGFGDYCLPFLQTCIFDRILSHHYLKNVFTVYACSCWTPFLTRVSDVSFLTIPQYDCINCTCIMTCTMMMLTFSSYLFVEIWYCHPAERRKDGRMFWFIEEFINLPLCQSAISSSITFFIIQAEFPLKSSMIRQSCMTREFSEGMFIFWIACLYLPSCSKIV